MKYLKYLGVIAQIIGALEAAREGMPVPVEVRGIRVRGRIYDLVGVAEARPEAD